MPYDGILTLGSGHSILTVKPSMVGEAIAEKAILEKPLTDTQSFGLFGGGLNYNTYYPDVDPAKLMPTDDEFIEPIYRLLSECIISKYYPTDFSKNNVLKNSMHLLVGQTINCDHDTEVGNAIGAVKSTMWQESYKLPNGQVIPAGINGVMKIDAKANPRIARGIMMDPPAIHSNSVTVMFKWEKSHIELSDEEFYDKLGSYDKSGRLICREVTEIVNFSETSLVSNGADPFAKQIRDGRIVLPEKSLRSYSFSSDPVMKHQAIFSDFKREIHMDTMKNSLVVGEAEHLESKSIINNKQNEMNELQEFLASIFGDGVLSLTEGQEVSSELALTQVRGMVSELAQLRSDVSSRDTQITSLNETVSNLQLEVSQNKPLAEYGALAMSELRTTTLENYRKINTTEDEVIVNLINTGDSRSVTSLNKSYTAQLEEKYPLSCGKCGSTHVSRASTKSQGGVEDMTEFSEDTQSIIAGLQQAKLRGASN